MQCPICKAELSSKRVAILDHDYDMLIRALFDPSLLTTSSNARSRSNIDSDDDEDDDDDIRALIAQAQQIKQDSLREATKVCAPTHSFDSPVESTQACIPLQKVLRGRKDYTPAMEQFEPVPSRKSRTSAGVAAGSNRLETAKAAAASKRPDAASKSQKQESSKGSELIARPDPAAGFKRPRVVVEADSAQARRTSRYENGMADLVHGTAEGLLHADVLAIVLQLPSESRLSEQMWHIRCCGAATLEYLQKYVAFRLRELDSKLTQDKGKVTADSSSIRFYVGGKDLLTVHHEVTDMSRTLASLYLDSWEDIDIPLMLYFGLPA
jgi:hypothetical protein